MLRVILVRPGSTDFDEQGRIKGSLDIPLNANGADQVEQTADELHSLEIDQIYTAPCQSARQTAEALASQRHMKVKEIDALRNLNHGLWQGKLIEEVKQKQPRVYRQWQEKPETVCPPDGESLEAAQTRVNKALAKLLRKHQSGIIVLVVPEPMASLVNSFLSSKEIGDLWKSECVCGTWNTIEIEPKDLVYP